MPRKVLGIVGSYRKGGAIDTLVSEVLRAAGEAGAETTKIYLVDRRIEFCTNCRRCTQVRGPDPGPCLHNDDLAEILRAYRLSDGLVLGAPVNFFNLNALTRRFMERLVCFAYWPWESHGGPAMRSKAKTKSAVLVTSAAMPGPLIRWATGAVRALRITATTLGARPIATLAVGLMGDEERPSVPERALRRARAAGRRLAAP
ncbi:MAG: flavodoxin family protein [Deltaproteobacteria bacterium]|nr:flavodoxin family protein [Deltaproteobacteria bacterium]